MIAPNRRRLAAILAADMVGYSRLMAADESGTLNRMKTLRKDLIDPELARHHGEVIKLTGDGMLVLFDSVVAAVEAAAAVQKAMAAAEAAAMPERRIAFRIGINLGDIILDDGDVYGDGVNVAARLEAEADAGGVTLSDTAFQSVTGKTDLSFIGLGELTLKNIPNPVRAHKIDLDPARLTSEEFEEMTGEKLDLPERPSIAVLPFQNMSGDPEQEFFADGMSEDILTTLSRVTDLIVMARNSTFVYKGQAVNIPQVGRDLGVRYVLEGSVRKAGNRVRITAQLIDAQSGDHVWAERFDRNLDDIFEVQDEITREIVVALNVNLGHGEEARVWSRQTESFECWELTARAMGHFYKFTREDSFEGQALARKAIQLEPESVSGRPALGWLLIMAVRFGFIHGDTTVALSEAREIVDYLQQHAPNLSESNTLQAYVRLIDGDPAGAIKSCERAIEFAPSIATNHAILGLILYYGGQNEAALARLRKAMRLSPYCPDWFLFPLVEAYWAVGDLRRARLAVNNLSARMPDSALSLGPLACISAVSDDQATAARAAEKMLSINPEYRVSTFVAASPLVRQDDRDRLRDALLKAGLPE